MAVPGLTWAEFVEAFRSNYIPTSVMRMKKNELQTLKQGNMSINKYLTKFNQLAHCALGNVVGEGENFGRFLEGLRDGLRLQLIIQDFHNFQHLVNKALILEK